MLYWEYEPNAPEGLAEVSGVTEMYPMLGSSGTGMKPPEDMLLEVGEGVQEASPDGGVTEVRGCTVICASPMAPERLEVELECARIPVRDCMRRCASSLIERIAPLAQRAQMSRMVIVPAGSYCMGKK